MFNDGFNFILVSLLRTMAMVYDFMVSLASGTSVSNFTDPIKDIVGVLYTLAGVFMLFRITISFINMLIDPDKINDKNGGPSKILTNVIITILLLILFQPSGFVYKELSRFEKAMIGNGQNGGFIGRLISVDGSEQFSSPKIKKGEEDYEIKVPFIENVSAAENLTCYFVKSTTTGAPSNAHGIVKLTFYSNKVSGSTEIIGANDKYNAYVMSSAGSTEKLSTGQTVTFKSYYGNGTYTVPKVGAPGSFDAFIDGFPKSCSSIKLRMASNSNILVNNAPAYITSDNYLQNGGKSWIGDSSVGYGSLDTAVEHYLNLLDKNNISVKNDSADASITDIENLQDEFKKAGGVQTGPQIFANAVAQSFYTCNSAGDSKNIFGPVNSTISEEDEKECALKAKNIVNQKNSDIVGLIDKEVMNADFIIGIILTIGFIVFLGILCVDVIIRNFKLVLLQMIAPIPIICGIDPKDKMRSQWFKMYFSTYAILFVYLFAIKLVSVLLIIDIKQYMPKTSIFQSAIVEIFYLIALLVFAKMIPSMISKIFGISADASSFKQIGGMLKGAALGAAGAAAVGTSALARTGVKSVQAWRGAAPGEKGANALKSKLSQAAKVAVPGVAGIAGALAYGAGSGAKGKPLNALSQYTAKQNKKDQLELDGSTRTGRAKEMLYNFVGMKGTYLKEKEDIEMKKNELAQQRYQTSEDKADELFPEQQKMQTIERKLSLISKIENKIETNLLEKNKYRFEGDNEIEAVSKYDDAVANIEAVKARQTNIGTVIDGEIYTEEKFINDLKVATSELSTAKKAAFDAVKDYELKNLSDTDVIGDTNSLKALGVQVGSFDELDNTKTNTKREKSATDINIYKINEKYAPVEEDYRKRSAELDERSRTNELSAEKVDYDAANSGKK